MDEDCANKPDPEEQLRILTRMNEITTLKVSQLKTTIETFTTKFQSQEGDLTNLYDKTKSQQMLYQNIIAVKSRLNEILEKLNVHQKLMPKIKTSPEQNFDGFMEAMRGLVEARNYLDQFKFQDAYAQKANLSHITTQTAEVILSYFKSLAERSATPVLMDNFTFDENGNFVCVLEEYNKDLLYPISQDILNRMHVMADILTKLGLERHVNDYTEARSSQIIESLNPILTKFKSRTILPGPLNILDLPTYKKRSHPIHFFTHILIFFFKRELIFARTIFGDNYQEAFKGSITKLFNIFMKKYDELVLKPEAHVDILFDLDMVGTLSEVYAENFQEQAFTSFLIRIYGLQKALYEDIKKVLQKYIEAVENHDPSAIPPRGAVTAVASNVLLFLGTLCEYQISFQQIQYMSFEEYLMTVLNGLHTNIMEKSKHYTDPVLKQLFLMNNAHYGYSAITSHPMLSQLVSQSFIQIVEDVIQNSQKEYMNETWNKASAVLEFEKSELKAFDGFKKGNPLTKTQKNIIKTKFKNFRDKILELQKKHTSYCLKNVKLMEPIKNEAISKAHAKFQSFYMRWHDSGFATHPEEYITITPTTLEGIITRMYTKQNKEISQK